MPTNPASQRLDLEREYPDFYKAPRRPQLVDLPEMPYLVVDRTGDPDGEAFQQAVSGLYAIAYALKSRFKTEGRDFKVPTFGGSWITEGPKGEKPGSD